MAHMVQRLSGKSWNAIALAGTFAIATGGAWLGRGLHQMALFWAAMLAAVLWALCCAGLAWLRTDEVAREAQKSAWFWGGAFGLVAALMAAGTMPLFPGAWRAAFAAIDAHRGGWPLPALSFVLGVMFAALAAACGWLAGYALWWSAKR